jgi:hypothetical protein
MPNDRLAQRLLSLATTPQRASAIVGDALEQNDSAAGFWLAIGRIFFALTWRWIAAAFSAAVLMCGVTMALTILAKQGSLPVGSWRRTLVWLQFTAGLLTSTAALASVRYGFRNRLSALAIGFTAVVSVWTYILPRVASTQTLAVCIAFAAMLALSCLLRDTRRTAVCVLLAVSVQWLTFVLCGVMWTSLFSNQLWFHAHGSNLHDIVLAMLMIPPTVLAGGFALVYLRLRLIFSTGRFERR